MGKRELLLIAVFLVLGVGAWQVAAPRDPDSPPFSFTQAIRDFRARMQGTRVPADVKRSLTVEVAPDADTLILPEVSGSVIVSGEERDDVECAVTGVVYVAEEKDREAAAAKVTLTSEAEGQALTLVLATPASRRSPKLNLEVRVPRRLLVRLAASGDTARVSNVRAVDAEFRNIEARLHQVAGAVEIRQRGGSVEVESAGEVTLDTRQAEVRLTQVRGKVEGKVNGDRVDLADVEGDVSLEVRRADLDAVRVGALHIEAELAEIVVRGLSAPLDVQARRGRVTVTMAKAVAVDIRANGAEIDVTLPDAGVSVDAHTAGSGDIRLPSTLGEPTRGEDQQTWTQQVRGGGPLVRLRGEGNGDIAIR